MTVIKAIAEKISFEIISYSHGEDIFFVNMNFYIYIYILFLSACVEIQIR